MIDKVTQIKVRKILQKMRYHDAVKYSGPIWMIGMPGRPAVYMGEDYEFRDIFPNKYGIRDWDSERAFIPKSKTRRRMEAIIGILDKHRCNHAYVISCYGYYHTSRKYVK